MDTYQNADSDMDWDAHQDTQRDSARNTDRHVNCTHCGTGTSNANMTGQRFGDVARGPPANNGRDSDEPQARHLYQETIEPEKLEYRCSQLLFCLILRKHCLCVCVRVVAFAFPTNCLVVVITLNWTKQAHAEQIGDPNSPKFADNPLHAGSSQAASQALAFWPRLSRCPRGFILGFHPKKHATTGMLRKLLVTVRGKSFGSACLELRSSSKPQILRKFGYN